MALQRKTEHEGAALKHYLHHPYRDEMREAFDRLGKSLEAVVAPRLVRKAA